MESQYRLTAATKDTPAHDVFPLDCVGHQATLPELKKAHRQRVQEKRDELAGALRISSGLHATSRRRTQRRKKPAMKKSH